MDIMIFYSEAGHTYVINDNWWGENNPKISANPKILANIYNATGNLIMNSWVVMNLFSASYTIDNESNIERSKFYLDMTYNNLKQKLSDKGYIPEGLEALIYCFNDDTENRFNTTYLHNGKAFVDLKLDSLFLNHDNIYVVCRLDNDKINYTFNKKSSIDISLFSSAEDADTEQFVNYTTSIDFKDNIYWITVSWSETGLFTGVIDIIVNGEIIKTFNITNLFYQTYKDDYRSEVFEAIKFFNNVFASMKEGIWAPNNYYYSFASYAGINPIDYNLVHSTFLNYIRLYYNLTDKEFKFVESHKILFVDFVDIIIDYHGDITPDINFEYGGDNVLLSPPSGYASRISNIYYTDIEDENNVSIGYEGMRSFAITKGNVSDDDLKYWLNQKDNFSPGLLKAAYGTFLTSLIVIYENDRVADEAAEKFNVTWSRISPVCVSLCNDYNSLYITGESDHLMGREAIGNSSSAWKFNFATSFSFSLVEQLVGNNVWNTTVIGSVTLGLLESYLNNETLEIFTSNGYTFIKREGDNSTLLFLEDETGIVRDYFSYYGLLGTMPCYHDNITENAWNYGNNLVNQSSKDFKNLLNISKFSSNFAFIFGAVSTELVSGIGESIGIGVGGAVSWPVLLVIAIPIAFEFSHPNLADLFELYGLNELAEYYRNNNIFDMTIDSLIYFLLGQNSKIPLEQRIVLFNFFMLNYPEFISTSILNTNSDLNKLIGIILTMTKKFNPTEIKLDINEIKIIHNGGSPDPDDGLWEKVGEKFKEVKDDLKDAVDKQDVKRIVKNTITLGTIIAYIIATIMDAMGKEFSNSFINLSNEIMRSFNEIFI